MNKETYLKHLENWFADHPQAEADFNQYLDNVSRTDETKFVKAKVHEFGACATEALDTANALADEGYDYISVGMHGYIVYESGFDVLRTMEEIDLFRNNPQAASDLWNAFWERIES